MTALLLVLLVLLVILNGLFVAAEIGLVRSRRAKLEVMANEGTKGAKRALDQIGRMTEYIAACQVGITLCSIGIGFLGEPSIAKLLEPVFGGALRRGGDDDRGDHRLPPRDDDPHHLRRAGAEAGRDPERRAGRDAPLRSAGRIRANQPPVHARPDGDRHPRRPGLRRAVPARSTTRATPRRTSRSSSASRRPAATSMRRGRDAVGRLPPPRAGGARGDDADPGGDHDRRLRHRRDSASPLHLLGPHPPRRDRGRQPGQGPRRRAQQQPRPPLHERRARRDHRAGHPRGAVLPRDEAARRPAGRASAAANLDRASSPTSTGERSGSSPSRTSSRRWWGRSRTRPTRARRSVRRLADGDWYARGHVSLGDLEDNEIHLPVDSDAFNSIGGYVFSELGRLPKRGDRIIADGWEIRVESVRDNRIVAVRIHARATAEFPIAAPSPASGEESGAEER